jgi:hypothetical protein
MIVLLCASVSVWAQHRGEESCTNGNPQENDQSEEDMLINMWSLHSLKRQSVQYRIIAAEACEQMARRMEKEHPDRFAFYPTRWDKFPDGTDNIEIGGFHPYNLLAGEHVLFLASFHDNNVSMSQFQVIIYLLQSFIESLTIVLPYYPVGEFIC